jgi:peptidoglycan/xylan/chitin deacetylase (PgdA/CDA1 family)
MRFPLIICVVFLIFIFYCVIPNYWARKHSKAVLRKGSAQNRYIALTFDDGPNPMYTPKLLDILKEAGIKATFFVVGRQALQHPDILNRIHSEGHLVGCHSFSHRHAWLMSPLTTFKDLKSTCQIIKQQLGHYPCWYRPPWGMFNLFSIVCAQKLGLTTAYWTIEAQDWKAKTTALHIFNVVTTQAQPGSIIVLHDNRGAPGAPDKTLEALPSIISTLRQKGYTFTTLDGMKGDNIHD